MKDSGIPWIGEIPADWMLSKVSRFYKIQLGKMLQPTKKADDDTFEQYLCAANVGQNQLKTDAMKQMWFSPQEKELYKIYPGDLLVVEGGDVASSDIVSDDLGEVYFQNSLHCVRPISDYDVRFLRFWLIAAKACGYIDLICNKATIAHFSKEKFSALPFPSISIKEQINIIDALDSQCAEIDAVLDKTRTSIEEYKKLKQAIITQAVTKGIRGDRPMKESGIEWVPLIPEDWSSYRGKHLFYETNERSETGSEELLTVSHKTGITPRSQKNVNMFMSESLVGYKVCREGDIAANTMWMWQGAIGVSAYHGVISPSYNTYRQRNGAFDSQYLDYLLRIPPLVDQYNVCSTGITASRLRLYPEQFLSLRFIVPPMEEQREIVMFLCSRVDEMDALIQKKEQFLTELEAYKKSLIYEYVTGKKEV